MSQPTTLTAEEARVLRYLQGHLVASAKELARACLPGASGGWLERVTANLEWLGYVIAYPGPGGEVAALQLTDRGRQQAGGSP